MSAALAGSAVFLLSGLQAYPIVLWDESRLAVNALEMFLTGFGLVTTYNFEPDLWNTKPPLLIWLMTASMKLFGPSEWALRLPSAVAAVATTAATMAFSWRLTRSAPVAVVAGLLLVASPGFHGRHAAATGDYDSLLTLCTTSYLCILFFALHRRLPPRPWLICAFVSIAAAVLTKGIAGLVPGAGIVLYLLLTRRITRPLVTLRYVGGASAVLLVAAAFYASRELAAPGYVQAVVHNEVLGRYLVTIAGEERPPWYFIRIIMAGGFSAGPMVLLMMVGIMAATGRVRLGILFAGCISGVVVLVYSASETKLQWYIVPAYPFLAIGVSLSALALLSHARRALRPPLTTDALICLLAGVLIAVAIYRYEPISTNYGGRQGHYGLVFAQLKNRGIHAVSVADGGDRNAEGFVRYTPRLHFYELLWEMRSFSVEEIAGDVGALRNRPAVVVTCDRKQEEAVRRAGELIDVIAGCTAVRLLRSE